MNRRSRCFLLALPLAMFGLTTTLLLAAGCELVVNISPPLDGSVSDVLDCGICADVSADTNYGDGGIDESEDADTGEAASSDATNGKD